MMAFMSSGGLKITGNAMITQRLNTSMLNARAAILNGANTLITKTGLFLIKASYLAAICLWILLIPSMIYKGLGHGK
jgi:hypothetical protein